MQFEINVGTDYSTVRFTANVVTLKLLNIEKLKETLARIGGKFQNDYSWTFPSFITSQVLQEVIRNTCFVCGGLMKDGTAMVDQEFEFEHDVYGTVKQQVPGYAKQIKVRKCSSCGHSHT